VLERLLNEAEPARWEVLNGGRRHTDFPELYEAFEALLAYDPDVVVYAMVLNDAQQSAVFRARQTYLDDWIINRREMLIDTPGYSLGRLDSRLKALVQDRLEAYRVGRETARWYREMYQAPNGDGWRRTQDHWARMNVEMRRRGGRLMMAQWPLLVGLERRYPFQETHDLVAGTCLRLGIPRHDLLPVLRGRRSESLWVHPVDRHPNETAHRLVAESLAPAVRAIVEPGR
jgi:hypothetical protein